MNVITKSCVSCAIALLSVTFIATPAAHAQEFMTQEELLATIPGHTIAAKTKKGVPWVQVYSAGKKKGTIEGEMDGNKYAAKWYVEGDKWCENWGDGSACWDVERVDATSLRLYENGVPKKNLWNLQ